MKHLLFLLILFPNPVFGQSQFEEDSIKVHQLLGKGGEAARNSLYDSANYFYAQAEALSRELEYQHGIMSSVFGYGLVHHFKREPKQALDYYLQAEDLIKQGIDSTHPDIERLYNNLGGVHIDLGYRLKAKQYLLKTLELKKANNSSPISEAITHYNLGLIYLYFGENQSALHNFMIAYPAYLEHYGENGSRVAQLYTNIGNIHDNLGNIQLSQEYYQRGITIHLENHGPDYWNLAHPYSSLGALYVKTSRRHQGLDYYLKSLELCRKNQKQLIRLEALNEGALAKYYLEEDEFEKSRMHANKAVTIMQRAYYDEHPRISEFFTILGKIQVKQGNHELANQWFEKARNLTIRGYGQVHPHISTLYLEESGIYHQMQDYTRAMKTAQQALIAMSETFTSMDPKVNPGIDEVLNVRLLMNIVMHKGDIYQGHADQENREENLVSALEQYQVAVSIIDHLRRGYLSESAKLYMQTHASEVYQRGVEVCYQLYSLNQSEIYLDQAFYFMEKSKSSVLSEALQASSVTAIQGVDSQVIEKEVELGQQIKSLELKLADAQISDTDSISKQIKKDMFHTKARVDSLADAIRIGYPNYHQLKYDMEVLELRQARKTLPDHALALSFFEATDDWYLLSFGSETALVKISKTELPQEQIDNFRIQISNPETELDSVLANGYLIYQKLLEETFRHHPRSDQLIIVPDGVLNYIPFDALVTSEYQGDQYQEHVGYLLHEYSISYRNSLTLHAKLKDGGSYDGVYVGFAPSYEQKNKTSNQGIRRKSLAPLNGARVEVERAGEMFGGECYLDQAATEYEFKNRKSTSSILHLAMHALVNDEDPMRSRLLFTQESDTLEDGDLNAYEIYQLKIDSELVVLSACNTGMGKINRGEGVMSLTRAFMYAGCPNIVMSLWQVKDQPSSQIMNSFFENLKKGLPKDESLRDAKKKYLSSADPFKAHPANWAAFVIMGDHRPLSRPNNPWLWIGLGGLFVVLGFLYVQQRLKRQRLKEHEN